MSNNSCEKEMQDKEQKEINQKIYELRKKGLTFQKIGDALGISYSSAYNKYKTYIEENRRKRKTRQRTKRD